MYNCTKTHTMFLCNFKVSAVNLQLPLTGMSSLQVLITGVRGSEVSGPQRFSVAYCSRANFSVRFFRMWNFSWIIHGFVAETPVRGRVRAEVYACNKHKAYLHTSKQDGYKCVTDTFICHFPINLLNVYAEIPYLFSCVQSIKFSNIVYKTFLPFEYCS